MVRLIRPDRPRSRNYGSRREQWRLLFLIVPLGLVVIAIGRLRDPVVALRVDAAYAQVSGGPSSNDAPAPPDNKLLAGVDANWLEDIADHTYFRMSETIPWFGMFSVLKQTPDDTLKSTPSAQVGYAQLVAQPDHYRGKLVTVTGYVRQVTEQRPAKNDVGIELYYRLVVQPADGSSSPIFVYCLELPTGLSPRGPTREGYLNVTGLFFKNLSYDWSGGLGTAPVVAAKNVAYFGAEPPTPAMQHSAIDREPTHVADSENTAIDEALGQTPDATLGAVVLRDLGFDEKLLGKVESRGPLRANDHEAFYQLLKAVGQVGAHQLDRFATQNLPAARDDWQQRLTTASGAPQRLLAQESLRSIARGRYNVAPLFNDAEHQQGRLFAFEGVARRVVRVEVGTPRDDRENRTAARFGFDHYFEMEVFTDDSQNHPLVFCLRELPPGFPVGEALREPVRVAGFFFKDWLFRARGSDSNSDQPDSGTPPAAIDPARYAPLLIGRAPLRLPSGDRPNDMSRYVGIGLFLTGLAGIGVAVFIYGHGDRRFRRRTRAIDFSLPAGQSLNDLNLADAEILPRKAPVTPTLADERS